MCERLISGLNDIKPWPAFKSRRDIDIFELLVAD